MLNIDPSELMLVAVVALVVIGPKDLPRAMRFVGQWVGRARGMARHFRMGMDEMIRQAELEEMQKKWADENARIMAEHPTPPPEEADDAAYAYGHHDHAMTALPPPDADAAAHAADIESAYVPFATPVATSEPELPLADAPAASPAPAPRGEDRP